MTEKELKKLSRSELTAMILQQQSRIEEFQKELADAKEQLAQREIALENAGSIAEASLQLNGVFDAAQAACQQYIENIRSLREKQEVVCARLENESMEKAARILTDAEAKARLMEMEASRKYTEMTDRAKTESEEYWTSVSSRLEAFYAEHAGLRELLAAGIPSSDSTP